MNNVEPLWGESPAQLVREFVDTGGRAVIACVDISRLDASWLGRIIDDAFLEEIAVQGLIRAARTVNTTPSPFGGPVFAR